MDIVTLIVVCVLVGLALWAINRFVPMQPSVKQVMNIAVVVLLVLWIIVSVLGGLNLGSVRLD
jgi:uncharacterized BrkB/YihY/UPF0761 family membrane protein